MLHGILAPKHCSMWTDCADQAIHMELSKPFLPAFLHEICRLHYSFFPAYLGRLMRYLQEYMMRLHLASAQSFGQAGILSAGAPVVSAFRNCTIKELGPCSHPPPPPKGVMHKGGIKEPVSSAAWYKRTSYARTGCLYM